VSARPPPSIHSKVVTTGPPGPAFGRPEDKLHVPVVHAFLMARMKTWIAGTGAGNDGLRLGSSPEVLVERG
jgi:hypothetical protein